MLRNVIAPSRDFTQIANAHVWDEDLSDAAFRLLVRAIALPGSKASRTTVTELASGLTGGRITADRARRQLSKSGLLHHTKWRCATGQVRSESLVSSVPLTEAEAEQLFAQHFDKGPRAGKRGFGRSAERRSGTALPAGETLVRVETSPHPVPSETLETPEPANVEPTTPITPPDQAERILTLLRRTDPRLVLGAAEVERLAPIAAEWLARGVSPAGLVHALTAGLPQVVKSPAALMRCRLETKMPPVPYGANELTSCTGCEHAFRPITTEQRCTRCRKHDAETEAATRAVISWRERFGLTASSAQQT